MDNRWFCYKFETISRHKKYISELILRQENVWKKAGAKSEKWQKSIDLGFSKKYMELLSGNLSWNCPLALEKFQIVPSRQMLQIFGKSLNQD